jgi:hypothetical protein
VWTGGRGWAMVCMRPLAQCRHATGVPWRESAGGSAMANEMDRRLRDAVKRGDVAGIAAALLAGADPNACEGTSCFTPLQRAAQYGHVAAITALLAAGALMDGASSNGTTALMVAAVEGHTAAVHALLAAGADVHRANDGGFTALHLATRWSYLDAGRALVEAGARADVRNKCGKRPIDLVRALPCLLAQFMRLHVCATLLHSSVDRRCGQGIRPVWLPCGHCCQTKSPGPAAGPWPLPATRWSGSGNGRRKRGRGGWRC